MEVFSRPIAQIWRPDNRGTAMSFSTNINTDTHIHKSPGERKNTPKKHNSNGGRQFPAVLLIVRKGRTPFGHTPTLLFCWWWVCLHVIIFPALQADQTHLPPFTAKWCTSKSHGHFNFNVWYWRQMEHQWSVGNCAVVEARGSFLLIPLHCLLNSQQLQNTLPAQSPPLPCLPQQNDLSPGLAGQPQSTIPRAYWGLHSLEGPICFAGSDT